MKCRTKPKTVEAFKFDGIKLPVNDDRLILRVDNEPKPYIFVADADTGESFTVEKDDYVIRDTAGKLSVCKAHEFDSKYDRIDYLLDMIRKKPLAREHELTRR